MQAWKPSRFATLLGDAVHAMSPTAGSGANDAFHDVDSLVKVIEMHGLDGLTEEIVGTYEEEMRRSAGESLRASLGAGADAFGQKPPEECRPIRA